MNNYVHPLTFALLPASPLVQFCCRMKPCLPLLLILVLSLPLDHSITHTQYMHAHKHTHTHSHEQCEYCRLHFGCLLNDGTNKMNWCMDNCNPNFTAPKRFTNISISNGDFAELRANYLLHSFGQVFYSQFMGKKNDNCRPL